MRLGQTAAVSDTGRKRRRNEDAYVSRPPLFAVADGMGGAQAGELASRLAVEAMEAQGEGGGEERVIALIQAANRRVYEHAAGDAAASGMGTTMTAALVDAGGRVAIGHVGDSRAYLLREGSLDQLTEDHSLVAELVRTGRLSEEEAETHPQRSVITRALGTDPDVDVDTFTVQARPGDLFLLCSDGLTTMVDDDDILQTIEQYRPDLDAAARALVKKANRGGGEDNITVICFEITTADAADGETARMPVLGNREAERNEEDTLDELDRVPAVDTMVVAPQEARRSLPPVERPARPTGRIVAAFVVLLLALAAIALLVLWGLTQ